MTRPSFNPEQRLAKQELEILQEHLRMAKNFVRQHNQEYFQGKTKIPVYLVLGPEHFGKTTLLYQAGLTPINPAQAFQKVIPTKYCNFWFTEKALYIDTAGIYSGPGMELRNTLIWQGLIRLIRKHFGKNSIHGVMVILDLPTLIREPTLMQLVSDRISQYLYEIKSTVKQLDYQLIFTKCDLLLGFKEFFFHLNGLDLTKPLGITFNRDNTYELVAEFNEKFDQLMQQLYGQITKHNSTIDSSSVNKLGLIFPFVFCQCKEFLFNVIGKLPNSQSLTLTGLYFTSSYQPPVATPLDQGLLARFTLPNVRQSSLVPSRKQTAYFTGEIFKKTALPPKHSPQLRRSYRNWLIFLLVTAISLGLTYQNYQANLKAIDLSLPTIHRSLAKQNTEELQKAIAQLENLSGHWKLKLGVNLPEKVVTILSDYYQQQQVHKIKVAFENYLISCKNQQPFDGRKIYYLLQTYRFLSEVKKLNLGLIERWIKKYPEVLPAEISLTQLRQVLNKKFGFELNVQLVAELKRELSARLSPWELVYLALENQYQRNFLHRVNNNTRASYHKIYSKQQVDKIYAKSIPNLLKKPAIIDPVLGKLAIAELPDHQRGVSILQSYYRTNYWLALEETLADFRQYEKATDLSMMINWLKKLISEDDKLVQKLKVAISELPMEVSEDFAELATKLRTQLENITSPASKALLLTLLTYFEKLAQTKAPDRTCFEELMIYIHQPSSSHPLSKLHEFIDSTQGVVALYLTHLAQNALEVLAQMGYQYIQKQWQTEILAYYQDRLARYYPFNRQQQQEVTIEDFDLFFSPHGKMDQFFIRYLEPLVITNPQQWQWKTVHGHSLVLPIKLLEFFLHAALIQKLFYPLRTATIKIPFEILLIELSPKINEITLEIDGQKIITSTEISAGSGKLTWPGTNPGLVSFSFTDNTGKYFHLSETGVWAWFRMVDRFCNTAALYPQQLELIFKIQQYSAKYRMATTNALNCFAAEVLGNFRPL